MVQSQSVTPFDQADIVPLMSADEARECVSRINGHMNSARAELLRLYEGRGWAALGYASWRECATAEFGGHERELYRALEAAQVEQNIRPLLTNLSNPAESHLRPLAKLTPIEQPAVWRRAQDIAADDGERLKARHVEQAVKEWKDGDDDPDGALDPPMELEQVADQFPEELTETDRELLATTTPTVAPPRINAGMFTSATPEWYTPRHIIDRVLRVFGGEIDLDPCSNSADPGEANVPANDYYTALTDGLAQQWHGRVYMNPPYGDEVSQWVARLTEAYEGGEIDEAIALLPARTDTNWFRPLGDHVIAFIRGRLRFSGAENSAPFPSVVVYLGPDRDGFTKAFEDVSNFILRNVKA